MKQINVLHVIDHFGSGGAQTIVCELLNNWNDDDVKLFCYALRMSNNNSEYCDNKIFISSNYKSKYNILSFLKLKKIIETEEIKIIHLHLKKSIIFGILLKVFFYKKVKIIVHEHGEIFKDHFWYNKFLNIFQVKIDLFIAVSESTKIKLIENARIKKNRIKILYNFINLDKFNPIVFNKYDRSIERKKLGLNNDEFVVGFAGRLNEVKGCRFLIKSIPFITIQNFKVLIAGEGNEKKKLKGLVKKIGVDEKILFLGYINEISTFYGIIDVLIVPSEFESFGISVIEAQACHVPVIASNVGALNEFIKNEENGLLFEPENEIDLAAKLMLLYKNQKMSGNIEKNASKQVNKFSLEEYLINLKGVYEKI